MSALVIDPRRLSSIPEQDIIYKSALKNIFLGGILAAGIFIIIELNIPIFEEVLIHRLSIYPEASGFPYIAFILFFPAVVIIIINLLLTLLSQCICYILVRLLGGMGSFKEQLYTYSLVAPVLIVGGNLWLWVHFFSGLTPSLLLVDLVFGVVWSMYSLYAMYHVLKYSHKISLARYVLLLILAFVGTILVERLVGIVAIVTYRMIRS